MTAHTYFDVSNPKGIAITQPRVGESSSLPWVTKAISINPERVESPRLKNTAERCHDGSRVALAPGAMPKTSLASRSDAPKLCYERKV